MGHGIWRANRLQILRKQVSQARSRATVDALVEATARILVRDGYDKASTNRIADLAGVSIGSLYQYYPSKETLVAAVIDRHNRRIMRRVHTVLTEIASQPIERAVRRLVAAAIEAHRIDPKLHGVLAEQIPRVGRLQNVEALNREGYALLRGFLESRRDELPYTTAYTVPTPQIEVVKQRAARRQILGDRSPLTAGAEHIHQAIHHFAHIDMAPIIDALGHKTRRRICPAYVVGLIGPGDHKSIQPMAARDSAVSCDQRHHFTGSGVCGCFCARPGRMTLSA